ncbi:MAG: hypothetical protein HQK83_10520 [Fibrobacteria bacterium]|nr:hypothetical protein [Fibrobacteria bacterium]
MKKIFLFAVCFVATAFLSVSEASFARVESMGKHATFFMDDVSIFDNAANMNVFPNFLIGEMGSYMQGDPDKDAKNHALQLTNEKTSVGDPRYNRDPENPWFGGIFSYSLGNKEDGNLYPQISLGGAFNRKDMELFSLLPDSVKLGKNTVVPEPVTNFDGFLGFTLKNGGMVGSHIYIAMQEGADVNNGIVSSDTNGVPILSHDISTYIFKGDLGLNWPLARNIDGELSFGYAAVKFGDKIVKWDPSFFIKGRAFSTLEIINGELVPIFNYSHLNAPGQSKEILDFGLGVNASLDRGFFWLGVEAIFAKSERTGYSGRVYDPTNSTTKKDVIRGGKISFGIERNIFFDWLVVRVGGQKLIASHKIDGKSYYMYTNPISDGTADDHIGWGVGLNIEEKLKVDATMAEDFLYTFGNIFSGPQHHVLTRISATYSF